MANEAEITETTEDEAASTDGQSLQSIIADATAALNTLTERLDALEEKGGDAPGFSNTDPDSPERAEGAGEDAPEVVADLSHGGTLSPDEMAEAGSPAGNPDAKPAKKPKAEKAPAKSDSDQAETVEETVEEAKAETVEEAVEEAVDGLGLKELREFQDLMTYSELGE